MVLTFMAPKMYQCSTHMFSRKTKQSHNYTPKFPWPYIYLWVLTQESQNIKQQHSFKLKPTMIKISYKYLVNLGSTPHKTSGLGATCPLLVGEEVRKEVGTYKKQKQINK